MLGGVLRAMLAPPRPASCRPNVAVVRPRSCPREHRGARPRRPAAAALASPLGWRTAFVLLAVLAAIAAAWSGRVQAFRARLPPNAWRFRAYSPGRACEACSRSRCCFWPVTRRSTSILRRSPVAAESSDVALVVGPSSFIRACPCRRRDARRHPRRPRPAPQPSSGCSPSSPPRSLTLGCVAARSRRWRGTGAVAGGGGVRVRRPPSSRSHSSTPPAARSDVATAMQTTVYERRPRRRVVRRRPGARPRRRRDSPMGSAPPRDRRARHRRRCPARRLSSPPSDRRRGVLMVTIRSPVEHPSRHADQPVLYASAERLRAPEAKQTAVRAVAKGGQFTECGHTAPIGHVKRVGSALKPALQGSTVGVAAQDALSE